MDCPAHVLESNSWTKIFEYPLIKIDGCQVLYIERDFFNLNCHEVKQEEMYYKFEAFKHLLSYYYIVNKKQINNKRAKERK